MKVAADFRRIARESLKGKWMVAVLAALVAMLLGVLTTEGVPKFGIDRNAAGMAATVNVLGHTFYLGDVFNNPSIDTLLPSGAIVIMLISLAVLIFQLVIGGIVSAGYYKLNLNLVDGEEPRLGTLFAYLPQWKTMVIANLLVTLYTVLWMLLFIIPGIVAAFRYSMTFYILAENPELSASEAINRSKELMDGNKWRFFCLGVSFIGWIILTLFTLGIGNLFLNPYMQAAHAAFYRDITAPLAEKEVDIPVLAPAETAQEG